MRASAVAASLAVPLLLVGCASPTSPDVAGQASPPATPAASARAWSTAADDSPRAAYTAWLNALERRDAPRACALQHPELTIELRYAAIAQKRAELGDPCVGFEALLWEDPTREYDPVAVEATQVTDEKATLAVEFAETARTVRLVYQRAAWRVLDESPRVTSADAQPGRVADPTRWVRAWCALATGMPREEVVAAMGEPSGVYTVANGGEPQLWWAQDQYDFRAYLDGDGPGARVLDLVGDYDALAAADRERLDCPELR